MADARPQSAARLDQRSGLVLPLSHRPRHDDGLCIADARRHGVRLFCNRTSAAAADGRAALGLGRIGACSHRHRHGDCPGRAGTCLSALHLLPAADRQSFLLYRGCARRRRLLGLGRADVGEFVPLETRQSRRAGAARDVRHGRRLLPVGVDRGRRGRLDCATRSTPGSPEPSSRGHCTPSSISG
jgi:hypothetical protein